MLDGRPGHEKQTLGIIKALEKKISVHLVNIKQQKLTLLQTLIRTCRLLFSKSGERNPLVENGDLLIGTGTGTHLSLLLYKRKYNIPAVTCMSPASYLRPYFDICFVPKHDGIDQFNNVFYTIGAPNCSEDKKLHEKNSGLILLGGIDRQSHHWDSKKISTMVEEIIAREDDIQWVISSSPRTPKQTVSEMENLVTQYNNCRFYDYKDTKRGWIEQQYDHSGPVWVTSDSISMMFEALSAGCNVGLLPVDWKNPKNKFKKNEEVLFRNKHAISYNEWDKVGMSWSASSGLNEAQRCADRILETWWPRISQ